MALPRISIQEHTLPWQSAPPSFLLVMPPDFPLGQYYQGVSGEAGRDPPPPVTDGALEGGRTGQRGLLGGREAFQAEDPA